MMSAAESTRERIYSDVLQILRDRVQHLDPELAGGASEGTRVMTDLEFESVTIVEFCMAVGKHYRKKFPFQDLVFKDDRFQDFTVGELVTFLERHMAS